MSHFYVLQPQPYYVPLKVEVLFDPINDRKCPFSCLTDKKPWNGDFLSHIDSYYLPSFASESFTSDFGMFWKNYVFSMYHNKPFMKGLVWQKGTFSYITFSLIRTVIFLTTCFPISKKWPCFDLQKKKNLGGEKKALLRGSESKSQHLETWFMNVYRPGHLS